MDEGERAWQLADEAMARFDVEGLLTHLSTAVRAFSAGEDRTRAAMACVRLGDVLANMLDNLTAGRAWFARARRLLEDQPPCVEQGWAALGVIGCVAEDPDELLAAAELALDLARRFGDINLETRALADAGLAHVEAGRVAVGMALLDEAMALACGPADGIDATSKSICSFFTACYFAADFERAATWGELLRRRGLISLEPPGPLFVSSHCDSVQATLLLELGRWGEAEQLLLAAAASFRTGMRAPASWHPDIVLADLRTRQGRFAEAEALLLGKEQAMDALLPAARLHLARGDAETARATARRGLRGSPSDRLRAVELLAVLVRAEIVLGDIPAAEAACADLAARLVDVEVPGLRARAAAAQAHLRSAVGAVDEAVTVLRAAVDELDGSKAPWLRATLLAELAALRTRAGDAAGAAADARVAAAAFAALDVVAPVLAVDLRPARTGAADATLRRDGAWWTATHDGTSVRLADTKGLRYLAALVGRPGVEHHALDLVDAIDGAGAPGQPDRRSIGDAGPLLDATARVAYRRRVEQLRVEADEALEAGLLETAEARQAELDVLVQQLAQAFGLGGRARRAGSVTEKARLNVTRAVRAALAKLTDALPEAGGALDRSVRTGLYCAYEPAAGPRWIVQP